MQLAELARRVEAVWDSGMDGWNRRHGDLELFSRLYRFNAGERFGWHGRDRPWWAPCFLVQYTLAGRGFFTDAAGATRELRPGTVLAVEMPGDFRYGFPPGAACWDSFWVRTFHPYVVERLRAWTARTGPVWDAAPGDPEPRLLLRLMELVRDHAAAGAFALERSLVDLAFAVGERAERLAGDPLRRRLEEDIRVLLAERPARALGLADLARRSSLARGTYCRRFHAAVGETPARYILRCRLGLARARLAEGATVEAAARAAGLADGSHLAKACRRLLGCSPSALRDQAV